MNIRPVRVSDATALAAIYAPSVTEGAASFELTPPTAEQMAERIQRNLQERPWLVLEAADAVLGYAYASAHNERPAYRWSVNVSVYVFAGCRRQGVGRALYRELFAQLRGRGYYNAYAGITLPNAASVGLHESFGFMPVGVYRHAGFKLGRWWDVGWWQKSLCAHTVPTDSPLSLAS
ncbi:MAG TPA: arsinothricin resistance N-acetyltransferase ArsN1 family B [Gammaproteobacteria bacterium]|nr:arsinothricin resistance N-acetyltransferase ArsN1 family B [Gammaproteobacteria bacterium]